MSLQHLAQNMAAMGRNGDSMLVHMTPNEVQHMQKSMEAQGRTLTINPHTGLPEAWLGNDIVNGAKDVLSSPIGQLVAGAALASMGIPPELAALYVGGTETVLTGSLKQGLYAGMGAYGGAGMMGGLQSLGATEAATTAADDAAVQAATEKAAEKASTEAVRTAGAEGVNDAVLNSAEQNAVTQQQLTNTLNPQAAQVSPINAAQTGQTVQTTTQTPGLLDRMGENISNAGKGVSRLTSTGGIDALRANMATGTGLAHPSLNQALGVGAAGMLGTASMQQTNPAAEAKKLDPGYIRQYTYDPYGQRYNALTPVKADQWGSRSFQDAFRAADGGIVALAKGGAVAHFDDGGTAAAPTYTASQINNYIAQNNLDAAGIAAAEKQFGVSHDQVTAAQNAQNTVQNVYENVLGRNADPSGLAYWTNQITSGTSTPEQMYANFLTSAKENKEIVAHPDYTLNQATTPYTGYTSADKRDIVDEWTQNVLGRAATDAEKQQQWYKDATNAGTMNTYDAAQNIYGNFGAYAKSIADMETANKLAQARQKIADMGLTEADVQAQTGKTLAELVGSPNLGLDIFHASQLLAPKTAFDFASLTPKQKAALAAAELPAGSTIDTYTGQATTTPETYRPAGASNPYGNKINPGDITINPDGSKTVTSNIPGRPYGGFTGMGQVRDAYTAGGGSLGYTPYVPKTAAEHDAMYNTMTGGSKSAFDYLTGRAPYSATPYTETGEIMKPYAESVLGVPADNTRFAQRFNPATRKYENNPDYRPFVFNPDTGQTTRGMNQADLKAFVADPKNLETPASPPPSGWIAGLVDKLKQGLLDRPVWMEQNNVSYEQLAAALGISVAEAKKRYPAKGGSTAPTTTETPAASSDSSGAKAGGLMGYASGGLGSLGGYSDGGRLLKGPGDGVSDSIPASIGDRQPARLADGEFVVPARIVSELGNGSTDAGARKLYQMMDRVQKARGKTTGKGKVATNSRADKYLPV